MIIYQFGIHRLTLIISVIRWEASCFKCNKSSVVKVVHVNQKDSICKTASKRKRETVCKFCSAMLSETAVARRKENRRVSLDPVQAWY